MTNEERAFKMMSKYRNDGSHEREILSALTAALSPQQAAVDVEALRKAATDVVRGYAKRGYDMTNIHTAVLTDFIDSIIAQGLLKGGNGQ